MTRARRAPAVLAVLALLGSVAACGGDPPSVVVEPSAGVVELEVGETLVVDFGEINTSVGDEWRVVVEPDPAVLTPGERDSTYLGEDDEVGAGDLLSYRFTAVAPGETSIEFQYAFRGSTDPQDVSSVADPHPVLQVDVS